MNLFSVLALSQAGKSINKTVLLNTGRFQKTSDNTAVLTNTSMVNYLQRRFAGAPYTANWVLDSTYALTIAASQFTRPGIQIDVPVLTVNNIPFNANQQLIVDNIIAVYPDPANAAQSLLLYEVPGKVSPDKVISSLTVAQINTLANTILVEEGIVPSAAAAPSNPTDGLIYFDTVQVGFFGWDGTQWVGL